MMVENSEGPAQLISELPTQNMDKSPLEADADVEDDLDEKIHQLKDQIEQTVQTLERKLSEDIVSKKFNVTAKKPLINHKSEMMVSKMDRQPMNSLAKLSEVQEKYREKLLQRELAQMEAKEAREREEEEYLQQNGPKSSKKFDGKKFTEEYGQSL
jgi:hypothetical protein